MQGKVIIRIWLMTIGDIVIYIFHRITGLVLSSNQEYNRHCILQNRLPVAQQYRQKLP